MMAAALTVSACTQEKTNLAPGSYKQSSSTTMPDGTQVEKETKTDIEVDRYGNRFSTVTTKTTAKNKISN
jgi:hypothetical protein